MTRMLSDWIDTFVDYAAPMGTPHAFRRWAAISAVAGAIERKLWMRSKRGTTYPNMYVVLVGSPGSGKTITSDAAMGFLRRVEESHLAPSSISRASLIDTLAGSERRITRPGENPNFVSYHALTIHAEELGVLIPAWDGDFMAHLTQIYDGHPYEERKRGGDLHINIERPWLNLLGDCTPSYLGDTLPDGAWDQGFTSRCIFIYSGEEVISPVGVEIEGVAMNNESVLDSTWHRNLQNDLTEISHMYGTIRWTEEAARALEAWNMAGRPPRVTHPRLLFYNQRRVMHVMKLCMISCASRNQMAITLEDYQRALDWLIEAEVAMPDIFTAIAAGGDARAMADLWDYVLRESTRTQAPVPKSKVLAFLSQRVPANNIGRILDLMVESHQLRVSLNERAQHVFAAGNPVLH